MASNLRLGFNQIALNSVSITSSNTCKDLFPVENLISRDKSAWVVFTSTVTTNTFWFDLGYDGASNITDTADFFAFPAQYIDTSNSFSVDLEASNNNSSWTTILAISESDLISGKNGFFGQDYLDTFTETSAYRYWRVVVTDDTASNAFSGAFSKFFFGSLFDFGADPHEVKPTEINYSERFVTDFGATISQKGKPNKYQFEIIWNNVSDAKLVEFEALYFKQVNPLIFFYADTNTDYFLGKTILTANVISYEKQRQDDFNEVVLTIRQAI